jgi:hypothetical protein
MTTATPEDTRTEAVPGADGRPPLPGPATQPTQIRKHPLTGQAAPPVALGALVLAAAAVNAAQTLSGEQAWIAAGTAATCIVVAVVAAIVAKVRIGDRKARARAIGFAAVAAGWMTCTAVTGLNLDLAGLLAILGTVLSLHWWRARRIPNQRPASPASPARLRTAPYADRWATSIGCQGAPLAGTRLESHEPIEAGHRYVLRLVPGKMSMATVVGQLDNVRTGLELMPDDDMILERHPLLSASRLVFTVITRSPVRQSVAWPGPAAAFNPATGRVALGPFSDGEGVATWKAYTANRMWGGFMSGGTGSGKSRTIESIAFALAGATTHPTVVWFGDGQGGASSPMLTRTADHAATTHEQINAMAAGALLIMQLRQDENVLEDREGFTPAEDRPGLLIVIDECQKPLSKLENPSLAEHTQYLFATIAREGGKVGVALLMASQQSTLDAFGGAGNNAEALRSNLLTGNGLALKSKDQNIKQVFGIDVNPKSFPDMPGYGYLIDPEPGGRSAPYRGYYLDDKQRAYWAQRIEWRSLDDGAANTYGPDYLRRRELATEAKEAVRRRVAARRTGRPVDDRDAPVVHGTSASRTPAGNVAQFPTWRHPEEPEGKPAREMHDGHRKVLDAIAVGRRSPKDIQEATGYSERRVHQLLGELRDEFRVIDGGQSEGRHGQYTLAEAMAGAAS